MMNDARREQIAMLRSLNGTSAHVLLALLGAGREQGIDDLILATGYEKRTLAKALALLEALGLVGVVAPQGRGWALPAAARERLLGGPDAARETRENGARAVRAPSSSSGNDPFEYGEKKKKNGADGARGAVFDLLRRGGVGERSPKMAALVAAGLDVDYVRGHVMAREAALERGEDYPVGWLIHKLECGDAAPAAPRARGYVPEMYADVVVR